MKKTSKLIALMLIVVMALGMIPMSVSAESADEYDPEHPYVLYYPMNKEPGKYVGKYASPYVTLLKYDKIGEEPYEEHPGANVVYNNLTGEKFVVYCIDEYTSVREQTHYKRLNIEDSTYISAKAASVIRSIFKNGFPYVTLEELASKSGVEGLTVGEAVQATQLAIWTVSYGDGFEVVTPASKLDSMWQKSFWSPFIEEYQTYLDEYNSFGDPENADLTKTNERISACIDYLVNLEPTAPSEKAVSPASFIDWSDETSVVSNGNGSYTVSVDVTVDVLEKEGDDLKLSAFLGDSVITTDLSNGVQTVTVTFENVPASDAYNKIKLAIDGTQTAEDVFLYVTEGGREYAQWFVGYSNFTLPVHEEITVEPTREINFFKSTKVETGTDENGNVTYELVPLEGIVFDLYFVADWSDYVHGRVELPAREDISIADIVAHKAYPYPDYSATTGPDGKATVNLTKNSLPDGVYVVAEREHPAIVEPAAPFYVIVPVTSEDGTHLEYKVDVSPKNDIKPEIDIDKDVIELGNNEASVNAYKTFRWIITANIPSDIAEGKLYKINDTFDYRIDYLGNVVVRVETNDVSEVLATLAEGTDYTLTEIDNDSLTEEKLCDFMEVSLTKAGMLKVASAVGERSFADCKIRVYLDSHINANAIPAEQIPNKGRLIYTNSVGFDFDVESDEPFVYYGGINVYKVDAKDETKPLAGAEFELYRPATEDEVADDSIAKVKLNGIDAPMILCEFFDNKALAGDKVTLVSSGEDGSVVVYGLAYGDYYFVETKAPEGYNLLTEPVKLTINSVSHEEAHNVTVKNESGFILPETGGSGTKAFVLAGSVIMVAAAAAYGIMIVTERRRKEEA